MSVVQRLDDYQRQHRHLGRPIAVLYKFFDDQGAYLAALITYYGFLSLIPLLLLLSTVLNFVLAGDPDLQQRVLNSALGQFPVVGRDLSDPRGVSGSGVGLIIGILGTIYGGLGVAQAAQNAMNVIWRVPRNSRPNPIKGRLNSLRLLLIVGLSVAGTTVLSILSSSANTVGASIGDGLRALFIALSMIINAAVFTLGFKAATARPLTWRQTLPGALGAAVGWELLQLFGGAYILHIIKHSTLSNSVFATVLGLLAWIYLGALLVVFAVEYNAVRAMRLWPRALLTPFTDDVDLTTADRASYAAQARAERFKGYQKITVRFEPPPPPQPAPAADEDSSAQAKPPPPPASPPPASPPPASPSDVAPTDSPPSDAGDDTARGMPQDRR